MSPNGAGVTLLNTGVQIASLQSSVTYLRDHHDTQYLQLAQLSGTVDTARRDLDHVMANMPKEETFAAVTGGGQSTFVASTLSWRSDINFLDTEVNINGNIQVPNVDYIKLSSTTIQFIDDVAAPRLINAGAIVTVRVATPNIDTPLPPRPYFVEYVESTVGMSVTLANEYDPTKTRLSAFRNGLYMVNSPFIGSLVDRYAEQDRKSILTGVTSVASDVYAFVNQNLTPGFKRVNSGVTGTVLTIPTYTIGSKKLIVWRNGLAMTTSIFGLAAERYTESSPTTVTLADAAVLTDWFAFENRSVAPTWREEKTGASGATLLLVANYTKGDYKLLVWRNGLLLVNSATIGTAEARYIEDPTVANGVSTNRIDLGISADPSDVFIIIYQ